MLTRDYNLRDPKDCLKLLENRLFAALLGMVYQHNNLSGKIGYAINGRHELRDHEKPRVEAMTEERKKLFQELSKYCRVIGYTAKLSMDSRVLALYTRATGPTQPASGRCRRHRSRPVGSITGMNQKSLFMFLNADAPRQARDLIVDIILRDEAVGEPNG